MSLMHRFEKIAMDNFSSYRDALAEAYQDEIENVEEGLWWLKVRYRAGRIARRKRREDKMRQAAGKTAAAGEPDSPQTEKSENNTVGKDD